MIEELEIEITEEKISCEYGCLEYSFDGNVAIVNSLNVYAKRNGIGTSLLKKFEEISANENCSEIEVPASLNSEALSFWKKAGYETLNDGDEKTMNKIIKGNFNTSRNAQGILVLSKRLFSNRQL